MFIQNIAIIAAGIFREILSDLTQGKLFLFIFNSMLFNVNPLLHSGTFWRTEDI